MSAIFTKVTRKFKQSDLQTVITDLNEAKLLDLPLSIRQDWLFASDCDYITSMLGLSVPITAVAYMQFNPGAVSPVHMDYMGPVYDKYALLIPVKGCSGLRMDWHKHKDSTFVYELPPPEGVVPYMDHEDAITIASSPIDVDYVVGKINDWHSVTNTGDAVAHLLSIRFFDTDIDALIDIMN